MKAIHLLRKPCSEGTVAANVLKHGVGGLNVDGCRVGTGSDVSAVHATRRSDYPQSHVGNGAGWGRTRGGYAGDEVHWEPKGGRWPANLVLQHLDGCVQDGVKKMPGHKGYPNGPGGSSMQYTSSRRGSEVRPSAWKGHADPDGTETVAAWVCVEGCPVAALDAQSGVTKAVPRKPTGKPMYSTEGTSMVWNSNSVIDTTERGFTDTGGASRFFKQVGGRSE